MRRVMLLALLLTGCALGGQAAETPAKPASDGVEPAFVVIDRVLGSPADPDAPLPWIVALHGMGDRADRFVHAFDGWDGPAVRLTVAQAPEPRGPGFSWFPVRVGEDRPDILTPAVEAQAAALASAFGVWDDTRAVDGPPIVTGFSQGGILSFALGLRHPDAIAAAVPVSGWLPDGLVPPHPPAGSTVPIRALHGTADTVLPFVPVRRGVDRLRAAGFDVTLQPFEGVGHAIPPAMRAAWWSALADATRTHAGRHTVAPQGRSR